ncbi:MAG TPA: hypothetical protein VGK78_02630 [Nocardioides sp.]|uniref:hypothetical protein n=1 Tax=Nocardioides sp. TaxID=35761 RepID=UPI002F4183D8
MIRGMTLAAGLGLAAYGGWRLLALGPANLVATLTWLVGGVVLHDAVLAPVTIALVLVAVRLVPRHRLAPWTVALIVLAPVTILSVPVLGRLSARATEPSLLDRPYWTGWFGLVAVVGTAILVTTLVRGVTHRAGAAQGGDDGHGHGRR